MEDKHVCWFFPILTDRILLGNKCLHNSNKHKETIHFPFLSGHVGLTFYHDIHIFLLKALVDDLYNKVVIFF